MDSLITISKKISRKIYEYQIRNLTNIKIIKIIKSFSLITIEIHINVSIDPKKCEEEFLLS